MLIEVYENESEDIILMKRYVIPKCRILNPVVAKPPSFFLYYNSRCGQYGSFVNNSRHIYRCAHSDPRLQGLVFRKQFLSSTTTTAQITASSENDVDKSKAVFPAQTSLEELKNIPVEEAARNFSNHCNEQSKNFDPHSELVAILESLHDNPQTSERFVKMLQDLSKNSGEQFRPVRAHYDMVLNAWLDFDPPSVKRAQALLDYMDDNNVQYDTESCNQILEAWANKGNAERTQKYFDTIIRKRVPVDLASLLHLFRAWSKSKSPLAVNRVERIMSRMENATGIKPNAECYLRVIECWAKCKKKGSETRIEELIGFLNQQLSKNPDDNAHAIRQEATLNLLQVYHEIGNAHRAEEILLEFANDFQTNVERPPPTMDMCLSVLSTWSKSASSRRAHRAEKFLRLMENDAGFPQPDTSCYTAVLNCIASSKKQGSAKKAEALLRRMDEKAETKSNMVSLTCVLIAWARSEELDAPIQAERIFQEILDRGMQPDRYVFGGLITAWGRSSDEDAIRKVEDYFQMIKGLEKSKPTVVEYTVVIQAYANYVSKNVDKSRESVERAEALLAEMLNSKEANLRPNILGYAAVLKTIAAALRIPGRGERAERVLQKMVLNKVEITPYIMNLVNKCNGRSPPQKQDSTSE